VQASAKIRLRYGPQFGNGGQHRMVHHSHAHVSQRFRYKPVTTGRGAAQEPAWECADTGGSIRAVGHTIRLPEAVGITQRLLMSLGLPNNLEAVVRRVRFYEYGGPEVLHLEQAPTPEPGPGEILVQTEAIGVTLPSVRKVRGEGDRAPLPGVLGGEIAGHIIAIGPQVADFTVGDRVTSLIFTGSYADAVLAPTHMASRIPDDASCVQAVALVRSGHVALAALSTAKVTATESILITGAASGVGHLAVQLAKIQGIKRVVAAVSAPGKADFLRGLGADEVVIYDSDHWGDPVDLTRAASVHEIIEARANFGKVVLRP
jgi:D-arabinose 1-dehydrogenase-like Zn-dependent alcohol dehydrogenase